MDRRVKPGDDASKLSMERLNAPAETANDPDNRVKSTVPQGFSPHGA
jgi:hypothetical protein